MGEVTEIQKRRVHVGGLFPTITVSDLTDKFSKFGEVSSVEIKVRKNENGAPEKTFAYIDFLSTEANWKKCMSTFNHTKWKGYELKLELAKPSFLEKLKEEQQQKENDDSSLQTTKNSHLHNPLENLPNPNTFEMRGAVPGTPIPGEKDWVVGKYGRILPILHLKKSGTQKVVTADPSKLCHNLKKLKDSDIADVSPANLTWEINHTDSEVTKKQKGNFESSWVPKKRKHTNDDNYLILKKFYDRKFEQSQNGVDNDSDSDEFEIVKSSCKSGDDVHDDDDDDDTAGSADTDEIIASKLPKNKTYSKHVSPVSSTMFNDIDTSTTSYNNSSKQITQNSPAKISESFKKTIDSKSNKRGSENFSKKNKYSSDSSGLTDESDTEESDTLEDHRNAKTVLKGKMSESSKRKNSNGHDSLSSKQMKCSKTFIIKNDIASLTTFSSADNNNSFSSGFNSSSNVKDKNSMESSDSSEQDERRVPEFKGLSILSSDSETSDDSSPDGKELDNKSGHRSFGGLSMLSSDSDSNDNSLDCIKNKSFKGLAMLGKDNNIRDLSSGKTKTLNTKFQTDTKLATSYSKGNKLLGKIKQQDVKSGQKSMTKGYEDSDSSETDSLSSQDTDEVVSSINRTRNNVKSQVKCSKDKLEQSWNPMDEYSTGFSVIDGDLSLPQRRQDTGNKDDDDDDDFENLSKLVARTKLKIMSSTPNPLAKHQATDDGLSSGASLSEESFVKGVVTGKQVNKMSSDTPNTTDKCLTPTNNYVTSLKKPDLTFVSKVNKNNTFVTSDRKSRTSLQPSSDKILASTVDTMQSSKEADADRIQLKKSNTVSAEKKHAYDNMKRLLSVKEREKENRMKKAILKKALSSVDGVSSSNKKIVFDSDDDDNDYNHSAMADSQESDTKNETTKTAPTLFDSADESEEEEDGDRFHLKQQFEGKSGGKLLALQSRIGADERFRLDQRFADTDEDEDISEEVKMEEGEKTRNLKILESVVGSEKMAHLQKQDYKKKQFKDIASIRFDPTREDHSQFEIKRSDVDSSKTETSSKKQKKKGKKDEQEAADTGLPEVDKTKYFEVSDTLKNAFKKTDSQSKETFSLLSAFGTGKNESASSDEEDFSVKPGMPQLPWKHDDSDVDLDSDVNEEGQDKLATEVKPITPGVVIPGKKRTFFFTADDERLKEGVKYFLRPSNYEDVVRQWRAKRPELVEAYKTRHKRALRRLQTKPKFPKR